jgi:hypothetical protein
LVTNLLFLIHQNNGIITSISGTLIHQFLFPALGICLLMRGVTNSTSKTSLILSPRTSHGLMPSLDCAILGTVNISTITCAAQLYLCQARSAD